MSSKRIGNQKPQIKVEPKRYSTDGADAALLASSYGLTPDKWQRDILDCWLGRNKKDKFTSRSCGLSVPRQNGKNALLEMRELYGLCIIGERILHSAHEVKTAAEAFRRLCSFFENKEDYPEMDALLLRIRRTNGQEAIELTNGGLIRFSARSRGAARGMTFDLIVMDEAQELTDEHMEAMIPTKSSSPLQNSQTIFTGTPPPPGAVATVFPRTRRNIIGKKDKHACWHEWSVEEIGDVTDMERAYETNPAMGIRISEQNVLDEITLMSPDGFARERLGWWSPEGTINAVIQLQDWQACYTDKPNNEGITCYAVKFSPDASYGALARAVKHEDGTAHVEVVDAKNMGGGLQWIIDWLIQRQDKVAEIVIDGSGLAQTLIDRLIDAGVHKRLLHKPRSAEFISATASFVNAVKEQRVTHYDDDELDLSATKTSRRPIGKEGFGFQSTEYADASLIEAVCLAYHSATTTKRNPNRKTGVCF